MVDHVPGSACREGRVWFFDRVLLFRLQTGGAECSAQRDGKGCYFGGIGFIGVGREVDRFLEVLECLVFSQVVRWRMNYQSG